LMPLARRGSCSIHGE